MKLFTEIGAMIDRLFDEPIVKDADIRERGAELIVGLWETEFEKFEREKTYSSFSADWKHKDFPTLRLTRGAMFETVWSASNEGHSLPLSKSQSARLEAVLTKLKQDREVASVEALAAAIVARAQAVA